MAERLAIAIPYHAGLAYLREAIESVCAQTDAHWTLLVVDDSPDKQGARELVEGVRDARVRYLANAGTLGMVACWNRCLDLAGAEAELVTLLHADDRLLPNYVEVVRALAARHARAAAFFAPAMTIDAAGRPLRSLQDDIKRWFVPRGTGDVVLEGEAGLRAVMRGNFIVCPSVCWRVGVLGPRRFDPAWRQVQDLDLTARLLLAGEALVGSRTAAYAYRRHAENATARQTRSLLRFAEEFELFDQVAARAAASGWRKASRTARHKGIVRLHLGWRAVRALARGDAGGAALHVSVLAGVEPLAARATDASAKLGELTGAAGGALAAQLAGMALVFATQLVLARALGAEGFGALAYALTWGEVLGLLAPLGFDKLQIRELARFHAARSASLVRGLLRCAARWTLVGTLAAIGVALAFLLALRGRLDPAIVPVFWLVPLLVPLRAWANLRHGALLGLSRPVAGMMATSVTHALVLLPLLALVVLLAPGVLTPRGALLLAAGSWLAALVVAERQVRARLADSEPHAPPVERAREWRAEAWPMLWIVGLALLSLHADVLMLGALRGAREAGIYRVAAQFAFLVRLGLVAVNPVLAPLVVRAEGTRALRAVATRATRLAFLVAGAVTAALLIGGSWALTLYEPGFAAGSRALSILALGFLVVTALGPVETILLMKNQQRLAAAAAAAACALNVALNALLIPPLGMEGAALATASSLIVWALAMSLAIRRRLGFAMHLLAGARAAGEI